MIGLWRLSIASLAGVGTLLVAASGALAQAPQAADLMTEANSRYERGEYAEAAQPYEALVDMGYEDAAIYYNLGSTYFEMGDLGRAILNYLRAQELSPRDPDILANLDLARARTVDRIGAERDSLVESVSYFGRRWVTPSELGAFSLLLWTMTGLGFGALFVYRRIPFRAFVRTGAAVSAVATLVPLLLLLSMLYANPYDHTGVVTAEAVDVVSGPGPQYAKEFTLRSGAEVRLVDSRQGWLRVSLPGGELQGWAPSHSIEAVRRAKAE